MRAGMARVFGEWLMSLRVFLGPVVSGVFLVCGLLHADEPQLIGVTERVLRGEWVRIAITLPQPDAVHHVRVLRVLDGVDQDVSVEGGRQQLLKLGATEYAFTTPRAGKYLVELALVEGQAIRHHATIFAIEDGPDPGPSPGPGPAPQPGKRIVLLLRETAESTPAYSQIVNSLRTRYQSYFSERQHIVLALDKDYPAEFVRRYLSSVQTYPALLIIDAATGALLGAYAMPSDVAEILERIKQHGG